MSGITTLIIVGAVMIRYVILKIGRLKYLSSELRVRTFRILVTYLI